MPDLRNLAAKISNYKCFGADPQGFDTFLPINVIIGRNNAGKSTLLELVHQATQRNPNFDDLDRHKGADPQINLQHPLTEVELRKVFVEGYADSTIGVDHWRFGSQWVGKFLTWRLEGNEHRFVSLEPPLNIRSNRQNWEQGVANAKTNPLHGLQFRRLAAERNMLPERDDSTPANTDIGIHGDNATRLLHAYLNKTALPRELVKKQILDDLNQICSPDSTFTEIVTRQHGEGPWEIFLGEEDKGLVALSKTGSGFKTILLVLIILHLLPHATNTKLSNYVFAFEELENNLHPAMLRRLLLYLRRKATDSKCIFLLTTHSNVVIDLFSKDENAQIIHVTHDKKNALAKRVTTYIDNRGILDDLDVRASDLLQANGIIWVEGPSDRVYLNRWIALWSGGAIQEGTHYQCVFYGGKLLAYLSGETLDDEKPGSVNILRTNRNAMVLIDSDKSTKADAINAAKLRIRQEIAEIGGVTWITKGRTIENYIPQSVLKKLYPNKLVTPVHQYKDFENYLNGIEKGLGTKFKKTKVVFAEKVCELFDSNDIDESDSLDLSERLIEVIKIIRSWNNLGELTDAAAKASK